jgi:hypothetical protein
MSNSTDCGCGGTCGSTGSTAEELIEAALAASHTNIATSSNKGDCGDKCGTSEGCGGCAENSAVEK